MFELVKYSLADRSSTSQPNGISCDDEGLFIAGSIPIAPRARNSDGSLSYQLRNLDEISLVLSAAYGVEIDVAGKANHLGLVTRYMNEGKWVLAKISAVQLGFPDLPSEAAVARALSADRVLGRRLYQPSAKRRRGCSSPECRAGRAGTQKRDVSNEPRVPAGQPGGGEWESGDNGSIAPMTTADPMLIPAQAVAVPIPAPTTLPWVPPTEITPFPVAPTAPNIEPLNPTANPYPDRPECVEEWAHAIEFCKEQMAKGKLKPGYSGFGKNFQKCVLGIPKVAAATQLPEPTSDGEKMTKITSDDLSEQFHLLRTDPQKYLRMANEFIRSNPDDPDGYSSRHHAWRRLGRKDLAMADLDKTLSLRQHWVTYESRGNLQCELGQYREALDDFNRAEAMDPEEWAGGFGLLFRADCHARLGDETAALADCARLPDDHWTPGVYGAPAGNKAQVTAEIRRRAAEARAARRL